MGDENMVFVQIELDEKMKNKTDEYSFILKPSKLGGVGVFCTHGIKKGTRLNLFPDCETEFIRHEKVDARMKQFLDFYAVCTKRGYSKPANLCHMQIGWYLNHSEKNNAHHDDRYRYFASVDIPSGVEITINYKDL